MGSLYQLDLVFMQMRVKLFIRLLATLANQSKIAIGSDFHFCIFSSPRKIAQNLGAHHRHHQQAAPYIIAIDNFNDARAFSSTSCRSALYQTLGYFVQYETWVFSAPSRTIQYYTSLQLKNRRGPSVCTSLQKELGQLIYYVCLARDWKKRYSEKTLKGVSFKTTSLLASYKYLAVSISYNKVLTCVVRQSPLIYVGTLL